MPVLYRCTAFRFLGYTQSKEFYSRSSPSCRGGCIPQPLPELQSVFCVGDIDERCESCGIWVPIQERATCVNHASKIALQAPHDNLGALFYLTKSTNNSIFNQVDLSLLGGPNVWENHRVGTSFCSPVLSTFVLGKKSYRPKQVFSTPTNLPHILGISGRFGSGVLGHESDWGQERIFDICGPICTSWIHGIMVDQQVETVSQEVMN